MFIRRSTEHEKTAAMMKLYTRHYKIVPDVMRDMRQLSCCKEDQGILKSTIKEVNNMLVEALEKHFDAGLCTIKYYLFDDMVKDIQQFGTLSIFGQPSYEHFQMHIKQAYKSPLQRK